MGYPGEDQELEVLRRHHRGFRPQNLDQAGVEAVIDGPLLASLKEEIGAVQVEEKMFQYIYGIVASTRESSDFNIGASPRAGIALLNCSKAMAAMRERNFVIPDDVKELAVPVLRHRVMLRPEAEIEGLNVDEVLATLVEAQVVPR